MPEGSVINGKQNPLENPTTKCGTESCINGIQRGNPQSWYLHDSPASSASANPPRKASPRYIDATRMLRRQNERLSRTRPDGHEPPNGDHTVRLLHQPRGEGATVGSAEYGGRMLRKEAACSGTPGNAGGEMWASPKLSADTKLTGYGGMTLYTQTLGNSAATVTLCMGIYDLPEAIPAAKLRNSSGW